MSDTQPTISGEDRYPSPENRLTRVSLRSIARWLTLIDTADPIRQVLNQGFAVIILVFLSISLVMIPVLFISGERAAAIISIIGLPVQGFMWWLNRRGTVYGATLFVFWIVLAVIVASPPSSYTRVDTPIPLLLILPVIMATMFIRPVAGWWAFALMMGALGVQLAFSDVPTDHAVRFMILGTLDLLALTVLLVVGASIFWRALKATIQANEALERQKEQYRYATLATQDAIYDWDMRAEIVTCNEAYQKAYGPDNLVEAGGSWWKERLHPEDSERVTANLRRTFQEQSQIWSDEYRFLRRDGQYAIVINRSYILYDASGQPVHIIGAITDITERKQAEAERLELALAQERAALLTEIINTLSHDLKTPLTIMNTSLYLLEKATDPEHQKSKVAQIKEQAERLGKLIQDILTLSRLNMLPATEYQSVNINQLIQDIRTQFEAVVEERHLTLNLELDEDLKTIEASEGDLQRALVNLVENALHYTPEHGSVTVRTIRQANQAIVEVSDTGMGISEADLPHIFEHFYRAGQAKAADATGTGLGLAIVEKVVKRHGGRIEVESHPGQGSTFRLHLPNMKSA
jgi:PAS domain S-box-containing protein